MPLSYGGGILLDQNGDWIESAPHLIKLTRTQFPSFMNIKANSAWLLSGGDRPGTEKRGKSMSPSYEWFYNSADAHGKIDSFTAHEESIDIHTVPTVEDDKYLTLNVGYSQYPFDFTLSGDVMPDAPITDDLKVPSTGASTADGNFVQAKMLIAILLIAVPITVLSVRRFIRRPKVTLSRKRNK